MIDTTSTTPDSQDSPVLVRHPVWCEESESEQRTYRVIDEEKNTFELVGGMEVDGRHVGRTRSLDCGEHFSWTVQVQLEQLYDEHEASPASIRLHCLDNDFVGNGTTAHLTVPEAERVIAMLQKAIRGMDLNARSEQQVSRG